jgi:3-dehydroquinate dehydratase
MCNSGGGAVCWQSPALRDTLEAISTVRVIDIHISILYIYKIHRLMFVVIVL